jgi:aryl sulfotransferase
MSLWNHYRNLAPRVYSHLNTEIPNLVGGELPECPVNIIKFWEDWIGTGWFDWESEGYPFWSNLHHTQSWWDYRHLDNILMIHYSDLISNPCHQIRKVAKYLDIGMSSKDIEEISIRTSFDKMKERSDTFLEDAGSSFIGGSKTFFNKGVDGRWRGVLGDKELAKYNSKIRDILTDDCRYWLERDES